MLDRLDDLVRSDTFKRLSISLRSDGRLDWAYGNPDGSFTCRTGDTASECIESLVSVIEKHSQHQHRKPRRAGSRSAGKTHIADDLFEGLI